MISVTTKTGSLNHKIVDIMSIDIDNMPARHQLLLDQEFVYLGNVRFLFGLLFIVQDSKILGNVHRACNNIEGLSIGGPSGSKRASVQLRCPGRNYMTVPVVKIIDSRSRGMRYHVNQVTNTD